MSFSHTPIESNLDLATEALRRKPYLAGEDEEWVERLIKARTGGEHAFKAGLFTGVIGWSGEKFLHRQLVTKNQFFFCTALGFALEVGTIAVESY